MTSILLKLDGVGVFATAPYVSYHDDDRAQGAGERSELCTPSELSTLSPLPKLVTLKYHQRSQCTRNKSHSMRVDALNLNYAAGSVVEHLKPVGVRATVQD